MGRSGFARNKPLNLASQSCWYLPQFPLLLYTQLWTTFTSSARNRCFGIFFQRKISGWLKRWQQLSLQLTGREVSACPGNEIAPSQKQGEFNKHRKYLPFFCQGLLVDEYILRLLGLVKFQLVQVWCLRDDNCHSPFQHGEYHKFKKI